MIFFLCVGLPLLLMLVGAPVFIKTYTKGNGEWFELVWRFSRWAKRPVYEVEYFGLPWEYFNRKEGKFRELETYTPSSYVGTKYADRYKEKMQWQKAPYPKIKKRGHYGTVEWKDCGLIQATTEAKARWEFRNSALFRQNPYLEFRVVCTDHGMLKSAKKRQQVEAQREVVENYRQGYIASLEEELNTLKDREVEWR